MEKVTFADWLLDRRRAAGLTQDQLADAIGRHRSYIVKLEKGRIRLPTEPVRAAFHTALGTTDEDLRKLGIIPGKRSGVWLYEQRDAAPDPSPSDARSQIIEMIRDPRIPDDAIEGVRRVLMSYLDRTE
ncbi:MAG: helix-turn-helix domain-containing protein [Thermomicrobiales bacterium]|nr:helix-turn-helix domain-containing protein [Thermomicrobiales bacterium]